MKVEIYHNPRCSKSRATLALLEEQGIKPKIIEYQTNPPNKATLKKILKALGCQPRGIMRHKQNEYKQLDLDNPSLSDDELLAAIIAVPILLERPIVRNGGRAAIGRPPENVLAILDSE